MSPRVERLIRRTSLATAALGVVFSPIPLVDEILLLPIYGFLASRIGKDHDLTFAKIPWKPIGATAIAGLAARAAVNVTVSYIPGVAAVANAVTAVALTQLFGGYVDDACKRPLDARPLSVQDIMTRIRKKGQETAGAPSPAASAT
jgi:uncharacterized protein (DUF697 family)